MKGFIVKLHVTVSAVWIILVIYQPNTQTFIGSSVSFLLLVRLTSSVLFEATNFKPGKLLPWEPNSIFYGIGSQSMYFSVILLQYAGLIATPR